MTQHPDGSVNVNGGAAVLGAPTTGVLGSTNSTADFSSGVRGFNGGTSGQINGIVGDVFSPDGWGAVGINHASTGGTGVLGIANATTGFSPGVNGTTFSANGPGVFGNNQAAIGGGGAGLLGFAGATSGLVWGVLGNVDSIPFNPDAVGIQAGGFNAFRAFSQTCPGLPCTPLAGTAGLFAVGTGGNLLVGLTATASFSSSTPVFRVDSTGRGFFNGGTQVGGADFAESVAVAGSAEKYQPGDLLAIDAAGERRFALSAEPYSTRVAGIYSTKPGVLATTHELSDTLQGEVPLAIIGIVPTKVSAENGAIRAGDLLVSSSTAGYAMKGTDRARMLGAVVGKALQPLDSGKGVIEVLVTLQ
jgi:hypothetical protein